MESLCSALRHVLKLDLNSKEALDVTQATVRYLCRVGDAYAYQRELKASVNFKQLDVSAKVFRLDLTEKSYFTLNIKFFAFVLCRYPVTIPNLRRWAEAFGIERNDVVMLRRAFTQGGFRRDMRASERFAEIATEAIGENAVTLGQSKFNEMYSEVMKHIRRKTFKKMRFCAKAENAEFADYNGEIMYKALKAYYMMLPTPKSDAYVLNYIRSTCTNQALNMINAKTTDKRNRMVSAGADGFGGSNYTLTCVSENQMAVTDANEPVSYEASLNDTNVHDNDKLLAELNFERVVKAYGKSSLRRRAILIVSGHDDERFTRYLRLRGIIRADEDSSDFVHRNNLEKVIAHMADHLNVRSQRLARFFKVVGTELIKHRSVA